jgi:hypothetical protein
MQIAYLNKGKIKAKSRNQEILEAIYLRDIRKSYNKNRKELNSIGISETDFVADMKKEIGTSHGIFGY